MELRHFSFPLIAYSRGKAMSGQVSFWMYGDFVNKSLYVQRHNLLKTKQETVGALIDDESRSEDQAD